MVTIQRISRELGLSVSTVSKALNGYDDVSAATRDLVLMKANELGYHPSAVARNLRKGTTDKIGLIINHGLNYISEYLAEIVAGVAYTAEENGKNVILYTETVKQPGGLLKICRAREVDGALLVWANPDRATLTLLDEEQMPYVLLGRRTDFESTSYVAPDNAAGAYALTRHLIEQGNARIAFMTRPLHGPTNQDRFDGYRRAIHEAGLAFDPALVVETALEPDSGYHAMNRLLDLTHIPSAVIAFNDLLAVDALRAAKERGLIVPGDVAIAGFDGLQSSLTTEPQITTVQQPLREMGQRSVHMLLERVADPSLFPDRLTFPTRLVIRPSTLR